MRDKNFIAVHRGGTLTLDNHQKLMRWAIACTEHVLSSVEEQNLNPQFTYALEIAKDWEKGNAATGVAMKVARQTHAIAREITNPILKPIVRSIAQAVSTAHMADHCLGASLYALMTAKLSGRSVKEEIAWQDENLKDLPPQIIALIKVTRDKKKQAFKELRD